MKIEEGKFYRTRDGRKVGPANVAYGGRFEFSGPHTHCHGADGKYIGHDRDLDIVAEWTDEGPVRTVTRHEIIPGTYDGVEVMESKERGKVRVGLCIRASGSADFVTSLDADELERAAAVLTALADALKASEAPR